MLLTNLINKKYDENQFCKILIDLSNINEMVARDGLQQIQDVLDREQAARALDCLQDRCNLRSENI